MLLCLYVERDDDRLATAAGGSDVDGHLWRPRSSQCSDSETSMSKTSQTSYDVNGDVRDVSAVLST